MEDRNKYIQDIIAAIETGDVTARDIKEDNLLSQAEKVYLYKAVMKYWNSMESCDFEITNQLRVYTWGCEGADRVFSPIEPSGFILLAGDSGMGKTAFTFDLAIKNACKLKEDVLYISLEMATDAIFRRTAMTYAGITKYEWQDRTRIDKEKMVRYDRKIEELTTLSNFVPLGISEKMTSSVGSVLKAVKEREPALVFIDNFNLLQPDGFTGDSNSKDDCVASELMHFCKKENIPIIVIHHLNKSGSIRGNLKIVNHATGVFICKRGDKEDPNQIKDFIVTEEKDRLMGLGGRFVYEFDRGTFGEKNTPFDKSIEKGFTF